MCASTGRTGWWQGSKHAVFLCSAALLVGAAAAGWTGTAQATEGPSLVVTPSAQVRQRGVLDSGRDFAERTGAAHRRYVTQRARLGLRVAHGTGVRMQVTLQDVRAWGEEADPTSYAAAGFGLYEGYGQVDLAGQVTLTAGRQGLSWDEERLIGKLDWAQRARAFNAVRLDGQYGQLQWQAFGTLLTADNAQAEADAHANTIATGTERVMGAGRLAFAPNNDWKLAAMYLLRWSEAQREKRHTAGAFVAGKLASGALGVQAEGYGQFGALGGETLQAWMAAARVKAQGSGKAKPAAWVWGEALSGNRKASGAFDTLYGTNHRYYGEMDFFLDIPKHTKNHGLVDAGAGGSAQLTDGLTAGAEWHWFHSARPDLKTKSTDLGHEIDVKATYAVRKGLWLQAVYGVFLTGDAMRNLRAPTVSGPLQVEQMLFVTVDATM